MKERERLELTFNSKTERDLWEFIVGQDGQNATVVKNMIREKMYEQKLTTTDISAPVADRIPVPKVEIEDKTTESTFDAARSPLFIAKEL